MITLREYQKINKPRNELLFNCSEFNYSNDEWVDFPIGMCVHFITYNGDFNKTQIGLHNQLVTCTIKGHTDSRRRSTGINRNTIINTLSKNGINNTSMPFDNYITSLPSYKFVISPEGNGIDCHRHYEALIAGCIPIIEDNDQIRKKYSGCPILFTKDYSEITADYLEKIYENMIDKEYDFSCLKLSSYSKDIQNEIKKNGNYWGNRFYKKSWY